MALRHTGHDVGEPSVPYQPDDGSRTDQLPARDGAPALPSLQGKSGEAVRLEFHIDFVGNRREYSNVLQVVAHLVQKDVQQ